MATFGPRDIGHMVIMLITGYRERGSNLLKSAIYGPLPIGDGTEALMYFTQVTGDRPLVIMAGSIMGMVMGAMATAAVAGRGDSSRIIRL